MPEEVWETCRHLVICPRLFEKGREFKELLVCRSLPFERLALLALEAPPKRGERLMVLQGDWEDGLLPEDLLSQDGFIVADDDADKLLSVPVENKKHGFWQVSEAASEDLLSMSHNCWMTKFAADAFLGVPQKQILKEKAWEELFFGLHEPPAHPEFSFPVIPPSRNGFPADIVLLDLFSRSHGAEYEGTFSEEVSLLRDVLLLWDLRGAWTDIREFVAARVEGVPLEDILA